MGSRTETLRTRVINLLMAEYPTALTNAQIHARLHDDVRGASLRQYGWPLNIRRETGKLEKAGKIVEVSGFSDVELQWRALAPASV